MSAHNSLVSSLFPSNPPLSTAPTPIPSSANAVTLAALQARKAALLNEVNHIETSADQYKQSLSKLHQRYEVGAMVMNSTSDLNLLPEFVIPEKE